MIPLAFYSLLATTIIFAISIGTIIAFFTKWALSLPIIFIFIVIFPFGWKLWKKYFWLKEGKKIDNRNIFLWIVILTNLVLILLIALIMTLNKEVITEYPKWDYRRYFDESKVEPSGSEERTMNFTEL